VSGRVLISTHHLERAGSLRRAFQEHGYGTDLVTPDEELAADGGEVLLVLSADAGEHEDEPLVRQARDRLHIPVIGYGAPDAAGGSTEDVLEIFSPSTAAHEVALVGRTILERRRLREVTGIVGETDEMREVLERVVQIAPVESTVLVTGESGTGKELVARGIHALSPRRHGPFIAVNVAALSSTLLESELFGHEKGAFTGAVDSRKGLFELAHGGTIFLDEIGEMPLSTQTKLLRVLEQREFHRVGGESSIRVDVRIVAATNQDLRQLVAIGDFRRDLYYRLNVLRIELPPLRDRAEDIPLLVDAFVRETSEKHDRPTVEISPAAMEILRAHDWPGNVRELRNLIESMVVLAPGREIRPNDIPPEVRGTSRSRSLVPSSVARRTRERGDGDGGELHPQLEFIFRTLVELRMDMDDLRDEFDAFRRDRADEGRIVPLRGGGEIHLPAPQEERAAGLADESAVRDALEAEGLGASAEVAVRSGERGDRPLSERASGSGGSGAPSGARETEEASPDDESVVVFRPGMTMEEMEREAIQAALDEVGGNRRKAAEMLGIGERTLYRKIKRFDL